VCGADGSGERTEIDDELDDLKAGDPLLPPDTDATGALEVVPVHDDVNGEVEGDGNPGNGGGANELSVAQEGSGAVVVAVQEGCELLAGLARRVGIESAY
jgi:hypothetical protein